MPSEALSVRFLDIHSASSGIDGGTGCSFIFFRIDIVCSIMGMTENSNTIWRESCSQFLKEQNNETFR